jgi:AAA15 family ATPase/GTPase
MITKLSIANFKSIRQLDIDCKKVNLFIGEPNTGRSNILETLGAALDRIQGRTYRFHNFLDKVGSSGVEWHMLWTGWSGKGSLWLVRCVSSMPALTTM